MRSTSILQYCKFLGGDHYGSAAGSRFATREATTRLTSRCRGSVARTGGTSPTASLRHDASGVADAGRE